MDMLWKCSGNAMDMLWTCYGNAMGMLWISVDMFWKYMEMLWEWYGNVMEIYGNVMEIYGHVLEMYGNVWTQRRSKKPQNRVSHNFTNKNLLFQHEQIWNCPNADRVEQSWGFHCHLFLFNLILLYIRHTDKYPQMTNLDLEAFFGMGGLPLWCSPLCSRYQSFCYIYIYTQ